MVNLGVEEHHKRYINGMFVCPPIGKGATVNHDCRLQNDIAFL